MGKQTLNLRHESKGSGDSTPESTGRAVKTIAFSIEKFVFSTTKHVGTFITLMGYCILLINLSISLIYAKYPIISLGLRINEAIFY